MSDEMLVFGLLGSYGFCLFVIVYIYYKKHSDDSDSKRDEKLHSNTSSPQCLNEEADEENLLDSDLDCLLKIKHIEERVKVNIYDPRHSLKKAVSSDQGESEDIIEFWTIGERISREQYEKYKDQDGELYAMVTYDGDTPSTLLMKKKLWLAVRV